MQNPGSDAGVFVWGATKHSCGTKISPPSFRDAPLGAGPESILTIVVMDSGLGAPRRPGMTVRRITSTRNTWIQINPSGILLFDQTYLPVTPPFLELFLARDSADDIVVDFEPNQLVDVVSRREPASSFGPMLISAPHDVVCYAQIKRAVLLARQEINVIGHRISLSRHSGARLLARARN